MRLTWPLIGRTDELRNLAAANSSSAVSGTLVCGPAGVGKSRVAREALSAAAAKGCQTRWVVGTSSARGIPLGAFTAWTPSGVTDTFQLLRGVIDSLTAASSGAKVVVGVDDVHLLDDLSIFVLHQIVQRGAATLILTVRDGAPIPAAIQELWTAGQFDRLDLKELPLDETAALLSAALQGPVDPDAVARLWQLTRGNLLYLRNIVEQEAADGRLVNKRGYWRWLGDPVMPPGLVDLIESRIGHLPAPVSDAVDLLAIGEPLDLEVLTRIAGAAAVEDAETRGLITLEPAGRGTEVRVAHPLYGEVRRRRAAHTRLRRLRGLVAAELAACDHHDDIRIVVRRATLTLDSDLTPDADLLLNAAHGAVLLADLSLADRLAEAAVHVGAGLEATFVRAHALSWLGRGEEAEAVLADVAVDQLTAEDSTRVAFVRASNILWALADPARAKTLIDEASCETPGDARTYLDAFFTLYWFAMDDPEAAVQASKNLVLKDIPLIGAEIAWALAQIFADTGRTTEALAAAESRCAATRSLDAPHMRFNIADAEVSAHLLAGKVSDAVAAADRFGRETAGLPGPAQLRGAAVAGRAALAAGNLHSACLLLKQATEGLCASHPFGWGYRYRIPYATALAMRGLTCEAAATVAELDLVERRFRSLDYELSLARAWVAAGQGAVTEAITILGSAAERARAAGRFAAEVLCLQTATQFGDRASATRLKELQSIVEGPRAALAAHFAAALCDGDGAELCLVSTEFEEMGDVVAAADAAAHAAAVYRRHDKRGSALKCSERAHALADSCGGAFTPAMRQLIDASPFTERESEIVMLIAEGLSNRALAERLTLSVRTVESHIYRAMAKTGTTCREELAALLPRHGSVK